MKKLFKSIKVNWKTSVGGIISALLAILTFTDVIDRENSNALEELLIGLIDNIEAVILAVTSIVFILSRDADKTSEDSKLK